MERTYEVIVEEIKQLMVERIQPVVEMDGGYVEFVDYLDGVVTVQMSGACVGCPSSSITLKMGIENMIKHYVPEVIEVNAL